MGLSTGTSKDGKKRLKDAFSVWRRGFPKPIKGNDRDKALWFLGAVSLGTGLVEG